MGPTECTNGGISVEPAESLLCLYSGSISESDDGHVLEVPRREVETGPIESGQSYRIALIEPGMGGTFDEDDQRPVDEPQPPVEPGEIRYVEIEDLGKQGDGIARVERGYVIIVPDSDVGQRLKIEISEVKSNFAVGEIIEST